MMVDGKLDNTPKGHMKAIDALTLLNSLIKPVYGTGVSDAGKLLGHQLMIPDGNPKLPKWKRRGKERQKRLQKR